MKSAKTGVSMELRLGSSFQSSRNSSRRAAFADAELHGFDLILDSHC